MFNLVFVSYAPIIPVPYAPMLALYITPPHPLLYPSAPPFPRDSEKVTLLHFFDNNFLFVYNLF